LSFKHVRLVAAIAALWPTRGDGYQVLIPEIAAGTPQRR
jgi:hypothetical protein